MVNTDLTLKAKRDNLILKTTQIINAAVDEVIANRAKELVIRFALDGKETQAWKIGREEN